MAASHEILTPQAADFAAQNLWEALAVAETGMDLQKTFDSAMAGVDDYLRNASAGYPGRSQPGLATDMYLSRYLPAGQRYLDFDFITPMGTFTDISFGASDGQGRPELFQYDLEPTSLPFKPDPKKLWQIIGSLRTPAESDPEADGIEKARQRYLDSATRSEVESENSWLPEKHRTSPPAGEYSIQPNDFRWASAAEDVPGRAAETTAPVDNEITAPLVIENPEGGQQ